MISRLRGAVAGRGEEGIVLDVNGVGYLLQATHRAAQKARGKGEVTLETYLHVREDVRHTPNSRARRRPSFSWTIPYPQAAVPGSIPRTFTVES